ncbi:hypothetical protein J6590_023736 [Homalodisca vitripennis]|nr:hypothetical protein J6590_023736 [Homalodisca vitripennis]
MSKKQKQHESTSRVQHIDTRYHRTFPLVTSPGRVFLIVYQWNFILRTQSTLRHVVAMKQDWVYNVDTLRAVSSVLGLCTVIDVQHIDTRYHRTFPLVTSPGRVFLIVYQWNFILRTQSTLRHVVAMKQDWVYNVDTLRAHIDTRYHRTFPLVTSPGRVFLIVYQWNFILRTQSTLRHVVAMKQDWVYNVDTLRAVSSVLGPCTVIDVQHIDTRYHRTFPLVTSPGRVFLIVYQWNFILRTQSTLRHVVAMKQDWVYNVDTLRAVSSVLGPCTVIDV